MCRMNNFYAKPLFYNPYNYNDPYYQQRIPLIPANVETTTVPIKRIYGEPQTKTERCRRRIHGSVYVPATCTYSRQAFYDVEFVYGVNTVALSAENRRKISHCMAQAEAKAHEFANQIIPIFGVSEATAKATLARWGTEIDKCLNNSGVPKGYVQFHLTYKKDHTPWVRIAMV